MNNSATTRLSPMAVAGIAALVMIALSWAVPFLRYRAFGSVDASVSMDIEAERDDSPARRKELSDINRLAPIKRIWQGEVFRTEERLREAEAVALGAGLYLAHEAAINRRVPSTANDLVSGLSKARLLPPGVGSNASGGPLVSERGTIVLRYRSFPLAIEVLSVGAERLDGPPILVRVPDDGKREEGAAVYVASRLDDVTVPAEFAAQAELIALGWRAEPARQSLLSEAERQKLLSWKPAPR